MNTNWSKEPDTPFRMQDTLRERTQLQAMIIKVKRNMHVIFSRSCLIILPPKLKSCQPLCSDAHYVFILVPLFTFSLYHVLWSVSIFQQFAINLLCLEKLLPAVLLRILLSNYSVLSDYGFNIINGNQCQSITMV